MKLSVRDLKAGTKPGLELWLEIDEDDDVALMARRSDLPGSEPSRIGCIVSTGQFFRKWELNGTPVGELLDLGERGQIVVD